MTDIWKNVPRNWPEAQRPSKASLSNAERLLVRLRTMNLLPAHASRGYWPTTILSWSSVPMDIEVFDGDFELFIYPPKAPGPLFDVHSFDAEDEVALNELLENVKSLAIQGRESVSGSSAH